MSKDGGPAFPHVIPDENKSAAWVDGMTLRDYFAAAALPAIITKAPKVKTGNGNHYPHIAQVSHDEAQYIRDNVAELAYQYADAMLKARGNETE
jgi:hypothetical protein